ncbi:MAG: hypothetical protein IPN15_11115 [Saprospiraceae bacterium]|nr:hypothetical protein [Candidatus Vicinibacter affinis]
MKHTYKTNLYIFSDASIRHQRWLCNCGTSILTDSKMASLYALTAGIVAIGTSANLWRFLWGPVVDFLLV